MLALQACTAGIGNSLVVESEQKNYGDLRKLTLIFSWLAGFCACCLMCLYQPFMKLWIGEENILPISCVACFVSYFFIRCINQLFVVYKDAAGMWHEDRYRPLATALTNLAMNLIMVQFIGIYGVLLSTVISTLIVGMPWILKNLFSVIFQIDMKDFVKRLVYYVAVSIVGIIVTCLICTLIPLDGIPAIVVRLCVCIITSNSIYVIAYRNLMEFKGALGLIDRIVGTKIKLVHAICQKFVG